MHVTHGLSNEPLYKVWRAMKQRCYVQKNPSFRWYGAVGIKVCDRWQDFKNFYEDMSPRPDGMQLDRIDSSKDYSKENCRWATPQENVENRAITVIVEYKGLKVSVKAAARLSGISEKTLRKRLAEGSDLFAEPLCRGLRSRN